MLKKNGKAWILSAWQIEVNRYPRICEKLKIDTWATDFNGIYGNRNFRLRTGNDEVLAKANSIWVYMDIVKGRPARPEPELVLAYEVCPPLDMEPVSRKIALPQELEEREENRGAKKEKKKKEKKPKKRRRKKDGSESDSVVAEGENDALESLLEDTADEASESKKKGFFARLVEMLKGWL